MRARMLLGARGASVCAVCAVVAACETQPALSVPPELIVRPDLTIGGAERGPSSFSRIASFAVDAHGRVYVLDPLEGEIRLFDSTARLVRVLGRRGEGPGEFRRPAGVALGARGDVFVYDPQQRRVTVFDSAGKLTATHLVSITSFNGMWEGGIDSAGRLVDRQRVPTGDTTSANVARRLHFGTGVTTIETLPTCGFDLAPVHEHADGVVDVPFGAGLKVWIDPDHGVWCAHSSRPAAYRVPFGSAVPTDSVVSVATPARVLESERVDALARVDRMLRMVGAAPVDPARVPQTKPVLAGWSRDDEQRIWLLVHDDRGMVYHVFDERRRWIARVRPTVSVQALLPTVVRRGQLYFVSTDSVDVPILRRAPVPMRAAR